MRSRLEGDGRPAPRRRPASAAACGRGGPRRRPRRAIRRWRPAGPPVRASPTPVLPARSVTSSASLPPSRPMILPSENARPRTCRPAAARCRAPGGLPRRAPRAIAIDRPILPLSGILMAGRCRRASGRREASGGSGGPWRIRHAAEKGGDRRELDLHPLRLQDRRGGRLPFGDIETSVRTASKRGQTAIFGWPPIDTLSPLQSPISSAMRSRTIGSRRHRAV